MSRQTTKKSEPLFSIVIPTYNRAEKVKQAINSVLAQSFSNFELLIMDDGSTDHTSQIVQNIADSRIRYEWKENSGGPATPRNRGIEMAEAEWICFLDADDIWYPDKLEVTAKAIDERRNIQVFCNNEICLVKSSNRKFLIKYGPFENDFYRTMLIGGNRVSTSAVTVNRNFLLRYNLRFNESPDFVIVEDYDLWLHIANCGGRFCFIEKPLGEYILENDNISSNTERIRHNSIVLLQDHVFRVQDFEPDKEKLWRKIGVRLAVEDAKKKISKGQYWSGMSVLTRALMKSPMGCIQYGIMKTCKLFKRGAKLCTTK